MQKVKDGEAHKVKADVTREVIGMYKDLEFSVRADGWEKKKCFQRLLGR